MCEDLALGAALLKVNGAKNGEIQSGAGVSGSVAETDLDGDGDRDSLSVSIEPETTVTAIVAMHGNRANFYEREFQPGFHGPFHSPRRKDNAHPPVDHWLVCGPAGTSPSASDRPNPTPSDSGSSSAPASPVPSESPSAPARSGMPVTGLALTGVILTGIALVSTGVAMRALRRRRDDGDESGEEPTGL